MMLRHSIGRSSQLWKMLGGMTFCTCCMLARMFQQCVYGTSVVLPCRLSRFLCIPRAWSLLKPCAAQQTAFPVQVLLPFACSATDLPMFFNY